MGKVLSTSGRYVASSGILNSSIANGYAYLASGDDGLTVLDVKKPNAPKLLSQLELGYVSSVAVSEQTAFVLSDDKLKALDLNTPNSPAELASVDFVSSPQAIVIKNKTAYISDWDKGLLVVDISDIKNLRLTSELAITNAKTVVLSLSGKVAAIISDETELLLIDVSKPANPVKLSTISGVNFKEAIFINDKTLAIAAGNDGVKIFDISKSNLPTLLSTVSTSDSVNALAVNNQTLFVAEGENGIRVVDVSNVKQPISVETIANTNASAVALTISDSTAYLLNTTQTSQELLTFSIEKTTSGNASTQKQAKPTGAITITGDVKVGSTLKITNTLQDENGLGNFSYQWLSAGKIIKNASESTYTLTKSDAGKAITVKVSYTDGLGKKESVTSGASQKIIDLGVSFSFKKDGSDSKDKLIGTGGNDSLTGNAGNDTLRGEAGQDYLDGGSGNDELNAGNDNDTLIGGDGNDKLDAGSGNDALDGGKDDDTLDGGQGNDTLNGGLGFDAMTGGDGNDYYFVENVKDKVIEANKDKVIGGIDAVESTSETYTLGENIEQLILKDVSGKGRIGIGNGSDNTIQGSIGDDSLSGLAGNDQLKGDKGNDTLDGGLGMDTLIGGAGDDLYIMQNTEDKIVEKTGEGTDDIHSSVSYNLTQSENVEYLTLLDKAIEGTGNELNNLLQAQENSNVNNILKAGKGDDTLNGEAGNDTLEGGEGDDELNGGEGNDVALFAGIYDDYTITINTDAKGTPQLKIEYVNSHNHPDILDGIDMLNDVEVLQFADGAKYNKEAILKDLTGSDSTSSAMLILTGVENV